MTRCIYSKSFVIGAGDSHQEAVKKSLGQLGNVDIDRQTVYR